MKRWIAPLVALCLPRVLWAQVALGTGIRFTANDPTARLSGLAAPVSGTAAIPVSVYAAGTAHWATATAQGDLLTLEIAPAMSTLTDGLLLRCLVPTENQGPMSIAVPGHATRPLLRTDGEDLPPAALRAGAVAELMFTNGTWLLLNPSTSTCPPGTLRIAGPVCMEVNTVPGLKFYQAVDHCAARGGKLCSWDEYATGCALLQAQLNSLFDEWEWIDDASNHTHSANQAGRYTCQSQRSANALSLITGDTRCCFKTR